MMLHYNGNLTCCGTHAIYSAFFRNWNYEDLIQFEAFTTVPFGIEHKPGNLYRLFTCYCDPDKGIDKALYALQVPFRIRYFDSEQNQEEAFAILDEWLETRSVVLGPLNMENLTYILHSHLLECMDHFIVVCGKKNGNYIVSDSEGMCIAEIGKEELAKAWAADKIPEGRGMYIMRQVLIEGKPEFGRRAYKEIFKEFISNMVACEEKENCGSNGLRAICSSAGTIMSDVNLQRRMCFDIPVKMQRCEIMRKCFAYVDTIFPNQIVTQECKRASELLKQQLIEYSNTIRALRHNCKNAFESFEIIADIEQELARKLRNIGDVLW